MALSASSQEQMIISLTSTVQLNSKRNLIHSFLQLSPALNIQGDVLTCRSAHVCLLKALAGLIYFKPSIPVFVSFKTLCKIDIASMSSLIIHSDTMFLFLQKIMSDLPHSIHPRCRSEGVRLSCCLHVLSSIPYFQSFD